MKKISKKQEKETMLRILKATLKLVETGYPQNNVLQVIRKTIKYIKNN